MPLRAFCTKSVDLMLLTRLETKVSPAQKISVAAWSESKKSSSEKALAPHCWRTVCPRVCSGQTSPWDHRLRIPGVYSTESSGILTKNMAAAISWVTRLPSCGRICMAGHRTVLPEAVTGADLTHGPVWGSPGPPSSIVSIFSQ